MGGLWWQSYRWQVHTQYQPEQSSPNSHKTMPEEKKKNKEEIIDVLLMDYVTPS